MCLVEGLRTDPHQFLNLVKYHSGDIRQLLLVLQLWAESGGSLDPHIQPIIYNRKCLNKTATGAKDEPSAGIQGLAMDESSQNAVPLPAVMGKTECDSEDEFRMVGRRPRSKRRKVRK